ncbi:MAG: SusC/RagA family TonB-linked outer membrane protein [Chitinophagaceae bacterium]|nr:SusC/RagA family TonB-linked outer membrane protein [Chitinophagaceae bacterium]
MVQIVSVKAHTQALLLRRNLRSLGFTALLIAGTCLQAGATSAPDSPYSGTPAHKETKADIFKEITGQVIDETGRPVAGATVTVKGSNTAVSTKDDGSFTINAKEGDELIVSHVSYQTTTVKVGATDHVVAMVQSKVNQLETVTITGYTGYSRKESPSATTFVTSKEINQVPMSTVDQILQGRVPGMSVSSSSGQPGQSAAVVIRGVGSISGSTTPLYVMDGIPIEGNYFQTINPQDIESMTILKDASAKALYGSRGSNGVIVITTKKGRKGKLNVGYNSQYGFSTLTSPRFEMMDTKEHLRFEEEVGLETGQNIGPGWTYSKKNPDYANHTVDWQKRADFILDSLRQINTDWRDMFFRDGHFMEQQVSLSGGNENIQAYNALGYWKEDGIVRRTGLERYTLRSNVNMKFNKFTAGVNISIGYSNSRFTYNEGGTSVGTPMASVYYALPFEYPYTPDGVFHPTDDAITFLDTREGSRGIDVLYGTSSKTEQVKSIIGANLGYEILPGLKITTRAGIDLRSSTDQNFINPNSYIGSKAFGQRGSFGEAQRRNFNIVSTSGITYDNKIDKHDFEISGFFEYLHNHYRSFNYTGYGIDDRLMETPAGITVSTTFLPSLGGGRTFSTLMSYMGVGKYTYNEKYTLTASYRYDGASSVSPNNRWHGFYSFGANWDAKKENFLASSDFISALRLRASYGQTASPFGGDFLYLSTYSVSTTYGGQAAIRPSAIGNPDFDWEYVDEFNTGFDLALFKSQRLKIIFDFYDRITRNMFIDQPLSATSGATSAPLSTGKMRNRGVELGLTGDVIQTNNFTWSIGFNGAFNKNTILHVTDVTDELPDGDTRIIKVGFPYGTYLAPKWAGVDPETGDALYYNRDGSITNVYNEEQQAVHDFGSFYPKITGGFTTNVKWRNITLDALFTFVSDIKRWNNIDFYIENQAYMSSNQSKRMLYDRWKKPGDHTTLQRIDIPRNYTSKDIQDASFMRLRNLRLAYSVPGNVLQKLNFVKSIDLFAQGENLLTWTTWRGLDPENNRVYGRFEYPNARTYTAGINVNF